MNRPSARYFELVKTIEDFKKFIGSGMAWVVEPNCPSCWLEHLELLKPVYRRRYVCPECGNNGRHNNKDREHPYVTCPLCNTAIRLQVQQPQTPDGEPDPEYPRPNEPVDRMEYMI